MKTQVSTIATQYYTDLIDVQDVEKMLNITRLPVQYDMIYVTIVIKYREGWQQEAYEIDGDLYVTLVLEPSALFHSDVSVIAKDALRSYLRTAQIEEREMELI